MNNYIFKKGNLEIIVSEEDYKEYVQFMADEIDKTRIGDILNYDMANYEDIMGTYAEINA